MTQPLDRAKVEECLTIAASNLIQAAVLLHKAGYTNEAAAIANVSAEASHHLAQVKEHLPAG